jgi:hypothetical protein
MFGQTTFVTGTSLVFSRIMPKVEVVKYD